MDGQEDTEVRPTSNIAFRLRALADWCEQSQTTVTPAELRALAAMADVEFGPTDPNEVIGVRLVTGSPSVGRTCE